MIRTFLLAGALVAGLFGAAGAAERTAALDGGPEIHGSFLHRLKPLVRRLADEHGLRPTLVMALIKNGSGFDPAAETDWGAVGLLPLRPETAGGGGLIDPEESLARGAAHLGRLHGELFAGIDNAASRNLVTIAAYRVGLDQVLRAFDPGGDVEAMARLINRLAAHRVWARLRRHLGDRAAAEFISEVTLDMRRWSSPVAAREVDRLMGLTEPKRPALAARRPAPESPPSAETPAGRTAEPPARAPARPDAEDGAVAALEEGTLLALDHLREPVLANARRYGIAPSLILAVMRHESAFNPDAQSHAGAVGLMQLVPETAGRDALSYLKGEDDGRMKPAREELMDPVANIELGATYLHLLANRHFKEVADDESRRLAVIAAYHAGLGTLAKALTGGNKMAPLVRRLNELSPKRLRDELMRRLPATETKSYIVNVTRDIPRYAEWDELV